MKNLVSSVPLNCNNFPLSVKVFPFTKGTKNSIIIS